MEYISCIFCHLYYDIIYKRRGKIKMKIAFCDDNIYSMESFIEIVEEYFMEYNIPISIHKFEDPVKLMTQVMGGEHFDIYFIDYEMPIFNGEILVPQIRNYDKNSVIGFVSAYDNVGCSACRVKCDMYLYKSLSKDHICSELNRIVNSYLEEIKEAQFNTLGSKKTVLIKDILYIESLHRKIYVHTFNEVFIASNCTLNELELKSEFSYFVRINRSHLINVRNVVDIYSRKNYDFAKMKNGEEFKVTKKIILRICIIQNKFL